MENRKIRVGITHGDINGVGYEVILKTFSDPTMLELCTPVVYGSPKVAAYHRKTMEIQTSFSIVNSAEEVQDGRVNVVNCIEEELKVELTKPTPEAGKAGTGCTGKSVGRLPGRPVRCAGDSSYQQAYHPVGCVPFPGTYGIH